jgi:quercetin dioxygenase-like cupin family protein
MTDDRYPAGASTQTPHAPRRAARPARRLAPPAHDPYHSGIERWHLPSIDAAGQREPRVLFSTPECRAVVLDLRPGDQLGEHSVRERATIQVVSGSVTIVNGDHAVEAGAGTLVTFAPGERHSLRASGEARLLLLLSPWPADSHYAAGEDARPDRLPGNAHSPSLD